MKAVLEGCKHQHTSPYGNPVDINHVQITCLTCYRRLTAVLHDSQDANAFVSGRLALTDAPAPQMCAHSTKKPVQQELTAKRDYTDAMCMTCGCVLRHPDGPGSWEPVRFYGYVIKEEPWS